MAAYRHIGLEKGVSVIERNHALSPDVQPTQLRQHEPYVQHRCPCSFGMLHTDSAEHQLDPAVAASHTRSDQRQNLCVAVQQIRLHEPECQPPVIVAISPLCRREGVHTVQQQPCLGTNPLAFLRPHVRARNHQNDHHEDGCTDTHLTLLVLGFTCFFYLCNCIDKRQTIIYHQ